MLTKINVNCNVTDGKFWLSPHGDLYIKDVTVSDKGSSYRCQTHHRLSGKSKTSITAGKLIVTGTLLVLCVESDDIFFA